MTHTDTEVAIVGAGPVGLTAALALARRGVSAVVVEREPQLGTFWRASTFHPPTLDVAADLGVLDEMLEQGIVAPFYQMRDHRAGCIARFDLDAIADETAWPFRLQLEQYKYSTIVAAAVAEHPGVEIRFGHELTGLTSHDDHVELQLNGSSTLRAGRVIAADGASSAVRALAGIAFDGHSYPTRRLLLSIEDELTDLVPDLDLVNYVYAPVGAGMVLRIPDVWRVMFSLPDEVDDATAASPDYYAVRLKELIGIEVPVVSTQVYQVHQRVASTLKQGNILLIGDAAHLNSPTGGMGLNSGIHDAFDLAGTLDAAGDDPEPALEAWAVRRRLAAVEEVQRVTHKNTVNLGESDESARRNQQDGVRVIAADPARTKEWLMESSMISGVRRYPIGVGRVAPRVRSFASAQKAVDA